MKRKRKITALCMLLCCLSVLFTAGSSKAAEEITLQAECGYDGYGKFGRNIPFSAEMSSTEAFQGVLRIIVPANGGTENYAYEYPVSMEQNGTLKVRGEIPFVSNYTTVSFALLDEKNRIRVQQQARVEISGRELTELYVGVISGNEDASLAFQGVNMGEYTDSSFPYVKTRAFALEAEDIDSYYYGLDCLDIIVIDKSEGSRLTQEQRDTLYRWVSEGGALVAEIASGFYLFSEDSYPVTEPVEARPYLWVQTQSVNKGNVGYFNLKVEDMELMEFAVDNNAIPGSLISGVCPAEVITQIIENDHYFNGEETYATVQELLDTAMGRRLPRIFIYVLVILLYLLLAGPTVFYVLRRKDKPGLTGLAVSGLAVLFAGVIYLLGTSTRFQEPVLRYASIWTLEGSVVSEETYIDVKAPNSSPYQVRVRPEYSVQPISNDSHYYYETVNRTDVLTDYKIGLYRGENATALTMSQSAPFESRYFRMERELESRSLLGLGAELRYFNEALSGSVYNETGKDFEDVMLVLRNGIYLLGDIRAGETVSVERVQKLYFYPDTYEQTAERVTGMNQADYQMNSENAEYAVLSQKTRLLEYYLSQLGTCSESEAILLAFCSAGSSEGIQTDQAYPTYGTTLLNKKLSLDTISGGLSYQNLTSKEIVNIDEDISYHEETGSTYSTSIRLQYNLGSLDELRAVRFAPAQVEETNPDYRAFSGEVYFYNPLTLAYEQIDLSRKNLWLSDLEKYLMGRDGQYSMIVQYSSDILDTEQYKEIVLPLVSVIKKK